jgi:hypothetical protein
MPAAMAPVDEVQLLPDPEQHALLKATLERVNRASNAARATALQQQTFAGAGLRDVVKDELGRAKLPDGFVRPVVERVEASLRRRAGKQPKFSTYQGLTLAPAALKWGGSDRVTMPTAGGRRTIAVRVDRSRGDLRPPLSGRPATLVYRNGEFELLAADVDRTADD